MSIMDDFVNPKDQLRGLQSVRCNRVQVLKKLEENRTNHRTVFEEALEGWHKAVVENLERMLTDAKAKKKFVPAFNLPQPQDHTRDYNRAITMLEFSLDEELELTQGEFAQYVLDDWGWQGDFLASSANYGSTAANRRLGNS